MLMIREVVPEGCVGELSWTRMQDAAVYAPRRPTFEGRELACRLAITVHGYARDPTATNATSAQKPQSRRGYYQ